LVSPSLISSYLPTFLTLEWHSNLTLHACCAWNTKMRATHAAVYPLGAGVSNSAHGHRLACACAHAQGKRPRRKQAHRQVCTGTDCIFLPFRSLPKCFAGVHLAARRLCQVLHWRVFIRRAPTSGVANGRIQRLTIREHATEERGTECSSQQIL
jgi:hypothetical protein